MSVETANNEFTRICVMLQSEVKKRRIQGLKEVFTLLELQQSENETVKLWDIINKYLLRILNDSVEECRDRTLEIIKLFIINLASNDKYIMHLLPILSKRLGSSEQIEISEEVRLKCITLLKIIVLKYENLLALYIDDLTKILVQSLADNYPLVKRESCDCISEFAKNLSRYFYAQSQNFVKPILNNFTHQHHRIRIASIKTIGDLIQYGNSKSIEEVATPMAERLFDQNGLVRKAVIEVAGYWHLNLKDRYNWWHKILPLLLTGLHDELEEIRQKAGNFWDAAGQLYVEENQNDEKLKNKLDFLTKDRDHYPNVIRPNLGCRVIAQQCFSKLINGICLELGDWIADIRVRSAQLLCVFILNIEEDIIQHIGKLLPPMYRACNDEDNRVVENVERAAEYLGYFVPPKIYCHLIIPTIEDAPSVGHLKVFSAVLKGSEQCTLLPLLEDIGKFLQQSHISINSLDNVGELYHKYIGQLFSTFSDYKSWSIHDPESQIFCACLTYARQTFAYNMDIILPVLKQTLTDDADPELRLKHFILLSEYFNQGPSNEIMDIKFSSQFLEDCILPGLIWTAGRTAEAIRTAAVTCLCSFLNKYEKDSAMERITNHDEENICLIFDQIIPVLISLADDNSKTSRFYSLQAMYLIMCIRKQFDHLTEEYIHKIYPILLKRLDDGCDDVRVVSLEALTEVWNAIPKDYDIQFNKGHVDTLYTTIIIYLDDPDSKFQNIVLDKLKELAKVHPELLYQKLQKCKTNFRNQRDMETLIEHCQFILTNE